MAQKEKFADATDILKDRKALGLYFYHVPSGVEASFKAFLTSYEDKFESKWNSERVYGRMDPIHTFQGTERAISLAWDVPAFSEAEGQTNFDQASKLYTMLYPTYQGNTISSSPLVKIKFGNLIIDASAGNNFPYVSDSDSGKESALPEAITAKASGLLGFIDGLTFSPDLESGFFDSRPGYLIPQTIKLSCNFHVLHTHKLGWKSSKGADLRMGSDARAAEASAAERTMQEQEKASTEEAAKKALAKTAAFEKGVKKILSLPN
tara:strand:+ start:758 stop:1549 length:792 start_codon:yes stop_codon:yes gene_type:complete